MINILESGRFQTFSLYVFRSPFHPFCFSRRLFLPRNVSPRGCFFLCGNIDPLYSYLQTRNNALLPQSACSPFAFPSSFRCLCATSWIGEHNNPENTIPSLRFPRRPWKSTDIGFPGSPTPLSEIVFHASFSSGDFNSTPFPSSSYLHPGKPRRQWARVISGTIQDNVALRDALICEIEHIHSLSPWISRSFLITLSSSPIHLHA